MRVPLALLLLAGCVDPASSVSVQPEELLEPDFVEELDVQPVIRGSRASLRPGEPIVARDTGEPRCGGERRWEWYHEWIPFQAGAGRWSDGEARLVVPGAPSRVLYRQRLVDLLLWVDQDSEAQVVRESVWARPFGDEDSLAGIRVPAGERLLFGDPDGELFPIRLSAMEWTLEAWLPREAMDTWSRVEPPEPSPWDLYEPIRILPGAEPLDEPDGVPFGAFAPRGSEVEPGDSESTRAWKERLSWGRGLRVQEALGHTLVEIDEELRMRAWIEDRFIVDEAWSRPWICGSGMSPDAWSEPCPDGSDLDDLPPETPLYDGPWGELVGVTRRWVPGVFQQRDEDSGQFRLTLPTWWGPAVVWADG